jgi:GAF domain-containing protein
MASQERLLEVFVTLADTMVAEFDVIDFMHTLTETCVELIGADAAGLVLADHRGSLQVVTATSDKARDLESLQLHDNEGPCLDCYGRGHAVTNVDPDDATRRWPTFVKRVRAAGFVSVHALPLRLRENVIGSLNLYLAHPGELSPSDVALGQGLAAMATIGLLQERAVREQTLLAEQLQGALSSRIVIEQAKGALAERLGIEPERAFAVMRRYARGTGRPLLTVATQTLDGTLMLRA